MRNAILLFAMAAAIGSAATYQIDAAHSRAGFIVKHMMVTNVPGAFTKVAGTVDYDPKNLAATRLDITIDAASVDTGVVKRDAHLRSADFFDVAKYPTLTFQSTKAVRNGSGQIEITGNLTMHGVTKPVVLTVSEVSSEKKDGLGAVRMGASAQTTVNRKDFGLLWNKTMDGGGLVVADEVKIQLDVELVRKAESGSSE